MRYLIRSATVIIGSRCFFAYFVSSGTRAIVPSSFMISQMTPAGIQAGDAGEVDRRLGLAASARARRRIASAADGRVPAARDPSGRVAGSIAASTVAARSCAEMPVVVPPTTSIGVQKAVSKRDVLSRTMQRNLELVEPLRRHRQANQTAPEARHEIDRFGRHLLGRDRQVALVLPILVVDDDDERAGADRLNRLLDGSERIGSTCGPLWQS